MHEVALRLDREELHLLVTWGYRIRELYQEGGEEFPADMADLLAKLKAQRDERLVF